MDHFSFRKVLLGGRMWVFHLQDVLALFPDVSEKTIKNNLGNWVRKGYIGRLRKDVYEISDALVGGLSDYYVANRLYEPSYVSLEAALSFYGVIPEEAAFVTSVTTKPTRTFRGAHGSFIYRTCKKEAYTGYRLMKVGGQKAFVADKEKALVDHVYYKLMDGAKDFGGDRIDLLGLDGKKAAGYAKLFNKTTQETVAGLFK